MSSSNNNNAADDGKSYHERRGKLLTQDLARLMFAFGDVAAPREDSVDLLEDMVLEYTGQLLKEMTTHAGPSGNLQSAQLLHMMRHEKHKVKLLKKAVVQLSNAQKAEDARQQKEGGNNNK
jgi:hypothetical protein